MSTQDKQKTTRTAPQRKDVLLRLKNSTLVAAWTEGELTGRPDHHVIVHAANGSTYGVPESDLVAKE